MNRLSVAQRPLVYDSVERTIDRSRTANRAARASWTPSPDQALTGVGKVSGSLHIAVNHAAAAAIQTADWVAQVPVQVRRKRIKLANAAFASMRARPFLTLGSVIAVGYIIGPMARR
jgi:hypothetical protein